MKKFIYLSSIMFMIFFCGCETFRLAPDEVQKQNAYIHYRTAQLAADLVKHEGASQKLVQASQACFEQSNAIMAYYGFPNQLPRISAIDDVLTNENILLTQRAFESAASKVDIWEAAGSTLDFATAIAGIFGGAAGIKFASVLKTAKIKSNALKEIVLANEIFKKENPDTAGLLKEVHSKQSQPTKQLVAQIKTSS